MGRLLRRRPRYPLPRRPSHTEDERSRDMPHRERWGPIRLCIGDDIEIMGGGQAHRRKLIPFPSLRLHELESGQGGYLTVPAATWLQDLCEAYGHFGAICSTSSELAGGVNVI